MKALKITIFAPSSPPDQGKLQEGLDIIKREGPKIIWSPNPSMAADGPHGQFSYLAGKDEAQWKDFENLIKDASLDFIWAARGGYGSSRWAGKVHLDGTKDNYPLLIGFSDVTFLHSALLRNGLCAIHAPLITTLSDTSEESRCALWYCLSHGVFPVLKGRPVTTGKTPGRLAGGNLTCLVHSLSTPYEPPWDKTILLIEDHNEAPYKIDRMLTHLLHSGRLSRLAGIAAGSLLTERYHCFDLEGLLKDRLSGLGIPVIMDVPAGHCPDNYPLLLGGAYELDADTGVLRPLGGADPAKSLAR
ncbi:MAG: LD-carboxypeptidase [Desulfobacteraceae bacterium]|nr:LD-carboxypeptidase [Desulfobacteraceae bacterium]